jgi:hypothetical protein
VLNCTPGRIATAANEMTVGRDLFDDWTVAVC